jgi:hypothetical protein
MNWLMQIVSVAGAGLILSAFFALQRGWWRSHGLAYLWFNFLGSALLTVVAVWDQRWGFIALELAWAMVSLWSIMMRQPPAPAQ